MTIKVLSNSTINKISAGEVIERPSSVVKELVENAIDAKATKISILLETAGKNLITIKDNGAGMSKEDLSLAIQRHATSKLDEDDLLNINSFGFRGEALPSICAISKFKITSKKQNTNSAHSLTVTGGVIDPIIPAICNEGTIIEVRDLFFATPARLKFLRTDRTELNSSISVIKKLALAHPNVAFTLTHNGKELIKVRDRKDSTSDNIENRINEIIGMEFIENSSEVSHAREGLEIYGYTSLPTYNRASAEDQFLFINNRPVKDKILNIALKIAYQDYLARDRHPISVLFLKMNPHFVDVNVHPAKTEVRFHDPSLIRGLVISAIKDALNNSSGRVSNAPSNIAINYMQNTGKIMDSSVSESTQNTQGRFHMPSYNSAKKNTSIATPRIDYALSQNNSLFESNPHSIVEEDNSNKELEKQSNNACFPLGAAKAQLHGTYIISQTDDSVIITDQHAAHERIGYENIKKQIEKNGLTKQRILIPEVVELPDSKRAELLEENKKILSNLALTIEKFGEKSIIVSEIPSLLGGINPSKLILDLADHLSEFEANIALTELIEHVTETYACHYSIRAGRKLNSEEMNGLLRQMEETPFSGQCNHGRQTYVELKLQDIEKLFGRR
ncbi:DNA mismatch repair endonuclease MutL [Rickettsiaceae bacterium]|nr:DNA mismatch repair endonuclease MutL [Rickettsiaceae bacterium]